MCTYVPVCVMHMSAYKGPTPGQFAVSREEGATHSVRYACNQSSTCRVYNETTGAAQMAEAMSRDQVLTHLSDICMA